MVKQNIKSKDSNKLLTNRLKSIVASPIQNNETVFKNRLSEIMSVKASNSPLKNRISDIKIIKTSKVEEKISKPLITSLKQKTDIVNIVNKKNNVVKDYSIVEKTIPKKNNNSSIPLLNKSSKKLKSDKVVLKKQEQKKSNTLNQAKKDNIHNKANKQVEKAKRNLILRKEINNTSQLKQLKLKQTKAIKTDVIAFTKEKKGKSKLAMETKVKEQKSRLKATEYTNNKPITPIVNLEEIITTVAIPEPIKTPVVNKTDVDKKTLPKYFGLEKNPFGDSLDTSFLYKSNQHEAALIKLLMSIEHDISFGLTFGKSGTGKTLLSQAILEKLPKDHYLPILVPVTPDLSKTGLLTILLKEFGYDFNKALRDTNQMVDALSELILTSYKSGLKPVIMMDECHFLSSSALHILRTLSNFEAFNKKLITCLLFAEDRFVKRLANPSYASLRNRIYLEVEIAQLKEDESKNYINHRLMIAGYEGKEFFSAEELKIIWKNSNGIPRAINKECTKIMVEKYLNNK